MIRPPKPTEFFFAILLFAFFLLGSSALVEAPRNNADSKMTDGVARVDSTPVGREREVKTSHLRDYHTLLEPLPASAISAPTFGGLSQITKKLAEPKGQNEARPDQPDEAIKWRLLRQVDENGFIPHNALMDAREQAKQMPINSSAWPNDSSHKNENMVPEVGGIQPGGWTWLGPGNIGGRIRSIIVHPTDPQTMWVGSVGGGIWKTTNGGGTWTPQDDFMANLAVMSMVIDPTNPNVLYAGTGEGV